MRKKELLLGPDVLGWVVKEMESRYRLMTKEGVRNIDSYNTKHTLPMPYIVVVVDEMSDLSDKERDRRNLIAWR